MPQVPDLVFLRLVQLLIRYVEGHTSGLSDEVIHLAEHVFAMIELLFKVVGLILVQEANDVVYEVPSVAEEVFKRVEAMDAISYANRSLTANLPSPQLLEFAGSILIVFFGLLDSIKNVQDIAQAPPR